MKICISISPKSTNEAIRLLQKIKKVHDFVELRVDAIYDLNLKQILSSTNLKLILTNRIKKEGGYFCGDKKNNFEILKTAIENNVDFIDIEYSLGEKFFKNIVETRNNVNSKTKIIISYHNFFSTQFNLKNKLNKMQKLNSDIFKIVTFANDICDNKKIFDLYSFANDRNVKLISFCMGEKGVVSRILCAKYNAPFTYASLSEFEKTAFGQLSFETLKNIYNVENINSKTKIFGLVGNPVSHSRGIYFHNKIFKYKKNNSIYLNFLVDDIKNFFLTYRNFFNGLSITMPFKEKVFKIFLRKKNKTLLPINTILFKNQQQQFFNTDYFAFKNLIEKKINSKDKFALIYGSGGFAKTSILLLKSMGLNVAIIGRSILKVKTIAKKYHCGFLLENNLNEKKFDIFINATPIGRHNEEIFFIEKIFHKNILIIDAMYSSIETPLIKKYKNRCRTINGNEIFVEQAKLQSKLFLNEKL